MAKIYVRIPRNRWTSIGEIDLDGFQAVYYGRKGGPVLLDEKVLLAIKKATELTRQIHIYEEKHYVTLLSPLTGLPLSDPMYSRGLWRDEVKRHAKHLWKLWQKRNKVSPCRLIAKQSR